MLWGFRTAKATEHRRTEAGTLNRAGRDRQKVRIQGSISSTAPPVAEFVDHDAIIIGTPVPERPSIGAAETAPIKQ
jgi:hypothetical protein